MVLPYSLWYYRIVQFVILYLHIVLYYPLALTIISTISVPPGKETDSMIAPSKASNKKKRVVLLAEVGAAVAVSSFLGAAFSAFVRNGGRDSSTFRRRQLRKEEDDVSSRKLPWTNQPWANLIDPKTVISKEGVEERYDILVDAPAEGGPHFRVHPRIDDDGASAALFLPSEVMIEVLNPKPNCDYSVTIQSRNFYTGTAMLLAEGQFATDACESGLRGCHLVYNWKPILPGRYDVLVHEIDQSWRKTPLIQPPHSFIVSEWTAGAGLSAVEDRILNMPPCQSKRRKNIFSRWEGDWLGPDIQLENSIRTGWTFLPSSRMGCKLETFDAQALRSLPEKKSIYILGRSVERGIFLSLVDIMLEAHEKEFLKESIIGKCWGRATVTKGPLEVTYQDFRSSYFEDPNEPPFIECHNDKLVKESGSSFIANATKLWTEIFQREESDWPSAVYFVAGYPSARGRFMFDDHLKWFVDMLPPSWRGTLFVGDFTLSGRDGGYASAPEYEAYLKDINGMVNSLGDDPRVRWVDGHGISREMRMYGQEGEDYVARSQHFHSYCRNTGVHGEAITVCSNVTEMMGQLLLGHAIGSKADLMERVVEQTPHNRRTLRWCHACPKCMLPFAIVPYPEMICVRGPIAPKEDSDSCPKAFELVQSRRNHDPLKCPSSCLEQEVTSEFETESDTVFVRQCPIP
jgi:hypothetical protein